MAVTFDWSVQPGPENRWVLFDHWRAAYDEMSLQDQIAFHAEFYKRWPVVHQHGDDRPAIAFFEMFHDQPVKVLEIGGWTGEAAETFLSRHPNIEAWLNVEISADAVANGRPRDTRYHAQVPVVWPWEDSFPQYNVLYLQHVVEHMKFAQFKGLLEAVPYAEWVFIQSPLEMTGWNWLGYPGCHILEVGWNQIDEAMEAAGYSLVQSWWDTMYSTAPENGRTRIYRRSHHAV